ncbi:serine/threonine-protein kinase DCLK3 [Brachionichthys hirsutus]|uniref:serine/threonine-protein kinase DCLK3 n=1 Tax=Brachionichthys hirsutus TaxID=412623 RepID=UPI003605387C
MTPSQRSRHGSEAAPKWRNAAPPAPSLRHSGGASQPWPILPHPKGKELRFHLPAPPLLPHVRLFHTRHAEESAERPHLVTVVQPCSELRKVTVLLNRRGVVSYEQLLMDISEALGFPRWHRARVTRLYTTHAREVKGVCDFFRGEVAFLALGRARPELGGVREALEELFPQHSQYRAEALQAWEKKLRPAPDKAAKADSGYSDGTDSSETHGGRETHQDTSTHVDHSNTRPNKLQANRTHTHTHTHQPENKEANAHQKSSSRKPAHLPNHLQRLNVRGGVRERQPSVIGLFKQEECLREVGVTSPTFCENCLARRGKHRGPGLMHQLSGKPPLPPISRKQTGSSPTGQVGISPPSPPPSSRKEEQSSPQLKPSHLHPNASQEHEGLQQRTTFDLPSGGSDVTEADIERCYEFGRVVGDGNFAVVRECRRRSNGQTLAVKIIERSKLIGREHMMQNELSLLGSLCHPRIVRLFAHHHTQTHSYLAMELVRGGDLFETISERGTFPEAEAGPMVSDVSEALNYIHCKSIVHRDLKPENLLIEHVAAGICRLKLGDFGLAMVVTEPVFTICGTPTYVAPEILCETGYGVAVDVWALGVILFVLLCGFPPFRSRDRDQEELFQLIKQGQIHFLPPYWDPVSEEARGLVKALLQPDPTARLTAEQTLLHPWVKAMTSVGQQRALADKGPRNTANAGQEPNRFQRLPQINAAHKWAHAIPADTGVAGETAHKDLSKQDEKQTVTSTRRAQEEDRSAQQHSERSTSQQLSVDLEAAPPQQKAECTITDPGSPSKEPSGLEEQDPGTLLAKKTVIPAAKAK